MDDLTVVELFHNNRGTVTLNSDSNEFSSLIVQGTSSDARLKSNIISIIDIPKLIGKSRGQTKDGTCTRDWL